MVGRCYSSTGKEAAMLAKRKLGAQGLQVPAIGLGCMGMTYAYGTPDDQESIATIHRAIELGCTLSRHGRSLRSVHQRRAVGSRAARPARSGDDRDEVWLGDSGEGAYWP